MNEVTFTGSVADASGLLYMNARYYNPATARFLSQDSYTGLASVPWTQHLYAYCNNNPVNLIDPTGHASVGLMRKNMVYINDGGGGRASDEDTTGSKFLDSLIDIGDAIKTYYTEVVLPKLNHYAEDITNFSINNTNEQKVYDSHYFSAYKGTLVFRHSFGGGTTSCSIFGIILLNRDRTVSDTYTLRHEYGHSIQHELLTKKYGTYLGSQIYAYGVAIPSLINFSREVSYEAYYNAPWERTADILGGVDRGLSYSRTSDDMTDWYLFYMGCSKEVGALEGRRNYLGSIAKGAIP